MDDTLPSSSKEEREKEDEDQNEAKKKEEDAARFECNICLDTARDAVVSMCGHLFCWPCLVQWLDTRPNRQVCPVCKAAISRDQVIPLYGRGGDRTDPRDKVPPRPRGQRTEASEPGFNGFQWGGDGAGGVQFSMGIGIFPISFMASWFSNGERRDNVQPGSRQHQEEQYLSNAFALIGVFFMLWLLLV